MKANQQTDASKDLMGEVRLARLELANAESRLATAKAQARLARRRRKEAKQAARRAKKQARLAKKKAAGAKLALAELEARLAQLQPKKIKRPPRRKPARKVAKAQRQLRPKRAVTIRAQAPATNRKPKVKRMNTRPRVSPRGKAAKRSAHVSKEVEKPIAIVPPEAGRATGQTVKAIEKIIAEKIAAESTAEPGAPEILTPPEQNPVTPDPGSTLAPTNPKETP